MKPIVPFGVCILFVGAISTGTGQGEGAGARPAVTALSLSPEGTQLLHGSQAGVRGRPFAGGKTWTLPTKLEHVQAIRFSPDGTTLAVSGGSPAEAGAVELYSWPKREPLARLQGHKDLVCDFVWLAEKNRLVTASADNTLKRWDTSSGECLSTLEGHSGPVLAVALSPDGKWLCSAGVDQNIRVWDTGTGRPVRALNNHLDTVHALAFRPAAKAGHVCLASASEDGTVRIWYPDIGRLVRIIRHKVPVYAIAWNHDGSRLYSGAKDGIVRVLDDDFRALPSGKITGGRLTTLLFRKKAELIVGDSLGECKRVDLSDFP